MEDCDRRELKDLWSRLVDEGTAAEKRLRLLVRAPGLLRLAESGPDEGLRRFVRSLAVAELKRKGKRRAADHVARKIESVNVQAGARAR
jgi:hypothetical protein